jgi:hypothetical protein
MSARFNWWAEEAATIRRPILSDALQIFDFFLFFFLPFDSRICFSDLFFGGKVTSFRWSNARFIGIKIKEILASEKSYLVNKKIVGRVYQIRKRSLFLRLAQDLLEHFLKYFLNKIGTNIESKQKEDGFASLLSFWDPALAGAAEVVSNDSSCKQ